MRGLLLSFLWVLGVGSMGLGLVEEVKELGMKEDPQGGWGGERGESEEASASWMVTSHLPPRDGPIEGRMPWMIGAAGFTRSETEFIENTWQLLPIEMPTLSPCACSGKRSSSSRIDQWKACH